MFIKMNKIFSTLETKPSFLLYSFSVFLPYWYWDICQHESVNTHQFSKVLHMLFSVMYHFTVVHVHVFGFEVTVAEVFLRAILTTCM